jgi:hypothetical protein
MLTLSKKTDYALISLAYLAGRGGCWLRRGSLLRRRVFLESIPLFGLLKPAIFTDMIVFSDC